MAERLAGRSADTGDWTCASGHRCAPEEGVCMICGDGLLLTDAEWKAFAEAVDVDSEVDAWPEYANETDDERRARFAPANDQTWGAGNWIECGHCLDGRGKPSFHHKEMHT